MQMVLDIPELNTSIGFLNSFSEMEISEENSILFYDVKLAEHRLVKAYIDSSKFHKKVPLEAGEQLKSLESLQKVLSDNEDSFRSVASNKPSFVCLGGGSLGDFVGFLASVYQRGVDLVQIPSTWLSAIDSAHGGKTALNSPLGKNQIGSFHQASKVFIIKELLFTQPKELFWEARSEIIKMYMLIEDERKYFLKDDSSDDDIMATIKHCVEQKYIWVKKDPTESTGVRQVLNLGHSMGHAFEKCNDLSHGKAVAMGLCFCLRYSYAKEMLKEERYTRLVNIFSSFGWWPEYKDLLKNTSTEKIKSYLISDKKKTSASGLNYVFLTDLGNKIEEVSFDELITFLKQEIMNA